MLSLAIERARENPIRKLPQMAALIYDRKGNFIGAGENSLKSHPLAARFSRHPDAIYLHAELAAIAYAIHRGRLEDLQGATMYVARVLKDGTPALAKPCSGCVRALAEFGIEKVEWTQ